MIDKKYILSDICLSFLKGFYYSFCGQYIILVEAGWNIMVLPSQLLHFVKLSSDVLYLMGEKENKSLTIINFPSKEGERRNGKEGRINKQNRHLSTDNGIWN